MLELWEENQDEAAISAEEEPSEMLAEETEKARHLRRRRMAAVGPYVLPEVRRGQGWEICEVPDVREWGLHLRAFMKGGEWGVAALFEGSWSRWALRVASSVARDHDLITK